MRRIVLPFLVVALVGAGAAWWFLSAPERPVEQRREIARAPHVDETPQPARSEPLPTPTRVDEKKRHTSGFVFDQELLRRFGDFEARGDLDRWPVPEPVPSRPVLLHVVDAITRAELQGVTVVAIGERLAVDEESPLEVNLRGSTSSVGPEMVEVVAAGHVMRTEPVDFSLGGEMTIALERAGVLAVTIEGDLPPLPNHDGRVDARTSALRPVIRVWRADDVGAEPTNRFVADAPYVVGRERLFRNLAPGSYVVSLERGVGPLPAQLLAEECVEVFEDEAAALTLRIEAPPQRRRVPFAGALRVPLQSSWPTMMRDPARAHPCVLSFEPIEVPGVTAVDLFEVQLEIPRARASTSTDAPPADPLVLAFDAGQVLPGRWLASAGSFEPDYEQIVEIGPDGCTDAELTIDPPSEVVVHVVDEKTGAPLENGGRIVISRRSSSLRRSGTFDTAALLDAATGSAHFWAQPGEIELDVRSDGFELLGSQIVDVRPGPNAFTLRVRRPD